MNGEQKVTSSKLRFWDDVRIRVFCIPTF